MRRNGEVKRSRREAWELFFLELGLMLVFLPLFLLLPWKATEIPAAPAAAVIGLIAGGIYLWSLVSAARAEDRLAWRAAVMRVGIGPGLLFWAAGVAFRLGDPGVGAGFFLLAIASFAGVWLLPPPPEDSPPGREKGANL